MTFCNSCGHMVVSQFPFFRLQRRVAEDAEVRREQQNPELLCVFSACPVLSTGRPLRLLAGRQAFALKLLIKLRHYRPYRSCVYGKKSMIWRESRIRLRPLSPNEERLKQEAFECELPASKNLQRSFPYSSAFTDQRRTRHHTKT